MKKLEYVIDTSSIIELILTKKDKSIDILERCITADLVFYEIGNFLWKTKKMELLHHFLNILNLIQIENVSLNSEVLKLAINENLTYYDSVYLYLSKKYNLTLLSEDKDLRSKGAKSIHEIFSN
ncbi:type II toxin-antitoxin system VapC family toxin [Sulfurisphaera javensis]|uniref:Type II toxin-antitoxin system VapC family toxin n=1 Tax=Sulfurisphaera javensis TaxID=2049879 RepID=A0AAT9GPP7_9CREN